jgi:hypothetical protein
MSFIALGSSVVSEREREREREREKREERVIVVVSCDICLAHQPALIRVGEQIWQWKYVLSCSAPPLCALRVLPSSHVTYWTKVEVGKKPDLMTVHFKY